MPRKKELPEDRKIAVQAFLDGLKALEDKWEVHLANLSAGVDQVMKFPAFAIVWNHLLNKYERREWLGDGPEFYESRIAYKITKGELIKSLQDMEGSDEDEVFFSKKGLATISKTSSGVLYMPPVPADDHCYECGRSFAAGKNKDSVDERLRVVAAAVSFNGMVYSMPRPARHHNILHSMAMNGLVKFGSGENQGFLLSDGKFYSRKEAGDIAVKNGQLKKLSYPPNLYSEDLW